MKDPIIVHTRKQADERAKNLALHTAIKWGWRDPCLTRTRRNYIAKAACRQVAYDLGYSVCLAASRLPFWYGSLNDSIINGENADPLSPSQCGTSKYLETIEKAHPGYIRKLYRYAKSVLGPFSTFPEMATCMNSRSAAPGEECPGSSYQIGFLGRAEKKKAQ